MSKISSKLTQIGYVELVCELKWNPTENRDTLEAILDHFLGGSTLEDKRFDGTYLVRRNSSLEGLTLLAEWIREMLQLDTVRKRLLKSIVGNMTAIYFNRQAAAKRRIALVDVNDNPPLGYVAFQIVSDSLESVIDRLAPQTYKGKEISKEELEKIKARNKEQAERRKAKKRRGSY